MLKTTVIGAGLSGLACAIVLARSGAHVTIHESRAKVGARFHGDFQGLENWSSEIDVLDELASFDIEPAFEHVPIRYGIAFDSNNRRYDVHSAGPLFYLVRRGSESGTLDRALYEQAIALGVTVRFNDKLESLDSEQGGVIAAGPRLPYAIAAGFLFATTMPDGCYIRFDEKLAPGGYAYLLIHDGRGTVAACLFRDFRNEQTYVERAVAPFDRDPGLKMEPPKPFGGSGSFFLRRRPYQGSHAVAGEYGGLQDAILGFGMRWAIRSGVWAARARLGLEDLDRRWNVDVRRKLEAGAGRAISVPTFRRYGKRVDASAAREQCRSARVTAPSLRRYSPNTCSCSPSRPVGSRAITRSELLSPGLLLRVVPRRRRARAPCELVGMTLLSKALPASGLQLSMIH